MRKSIKCGIAAAVVMAAGFAAYQTYGAYGAQDNSLLMQNIEALAGDAGGEGNSNKLPAHECYTYGEDTPGMYGYQKVKEYICSEKISDYIIINIIFCVIKHDKDNVACVFPF